MTVANRPKDREITSLIAAEGTKRIYQMNDGSIETREGGSVSWRNNNPDNLKFEYANSADKSVHTRRTRDEALSAAQSNYAGVVALDQWGNAVFKTEEAGRAAQATLLNRRHGDHTVEQMLPSYAVDDYSGKANIKAYANGIYTAGDAQGVDLRTKKIGEMRAAEMSALEDGMKKVEGYKAGDVKISPPSFRQIEERSMQKMNEQGLTPRASATLITDPTHPGNVMFKQAQTGMQAIDTKFRRVSDSQTDNAAGVVALRAHGAGMTRIDVMDVNDKGDKIIAAQGQPGSVHSKLIDVPTVTALNTPLAQSSQDFADGQQSRPASNPSNPQQATQGPAEQQAALVRA